MKNPRLVKAGVATILSASLVTSNAAPVLAEAVTDVTGSTGESKQVRETGASTAPANLEEAKLALKKAEDALKAAESARDLTENVLNTKNGVLSTASGEYSSASGALTAAQNESISAFTNIVSKNAQNVAEKNAELEEAKEALKDAEDAQERAESEKAEAEREKTSTENSYQSALADKNDKADKLATAIDEESVAKDAYKAALSEYNEALRNYNTASSETNTAKEALDAARQAITRASEAKTAAEADLENAKDDLLEAQNRLSAIDENSTEYLLAQDELRLKEEAYNSKKALVATTSAELETASEECAEAETAYSEAKAKLDARSDLFNEVVRTAQVKAAAADVLQSKIEAKNDAAEEKTLCENVVANAESSLNTANSELGAANTALEEATKALEDAEAQYEKEKADAAKALEDANAAYAEAGKNFLSENLVGDGITYQSMHDGTLDSMLVKQTGMFDTEKDIQRFETVLEHLLMVDNLIRAAELSKIGNQHRVSEGLSELKLDYNLMLFSALCNAVSAITNDHTLYPEADLAGVPETSSIGENLAWAGGDPYDVWYVGEKELMEEELAKKAEDPNYQIKYSLYGHYRTLTDKDYTVTGMTSDGHNHEQFFSEQAAGKTATPEEFIAALETYANVFLTKVNDAQGRVDELKNAPDYLTAARENYNNALEAVNLKTEKKNTAVENLASANSALETATENLEKKTSDYTSYLNGGYKDAKAAYENAQETLRVFDEKHPTVEIDEAQAKNSFLAASETKTEKQTAYNKALEEAAAAKAEFDKATDKMNKIISSVDEAKAEVAKEQANVILKETALDNAKTELEGAERDASSKEDTYNSLKTISDTLSQTLADKETALNEKASIRDDKASAKNSAEQAFNEADSALNAAKETLDAATSALTGKVEALRSAKEQVAKKTEDVASAEAALAAARTKYDQAQAVREDDPSTYEENFPELAQLKAAVASAEANLASKKNALDAASSAAASAQADYDRALSEYALAVADYNLALEYVEKYTVYDITKEKGIKVSGVSNKTYTGKAIPQKITVTFNGKPVTVKISYPGGNTKVGKHTVYVTGTGKFKGTLKYSYSILPKMVGKRTYTRGRTSIRVAYKKVSNVSGYQIAYRKKGSSKWIYKSTTSTKKTLSSLKKNTTYEIKVRTYKKVGSTKYYSNWCTTERKSTK